MRRRRITLGIGLLLSAAMTLTACGGASGGDKTNTSSAAAAADPNGVLVRGIDLTFQGGVGFDPATMRPGWYEQTYPITNSWLKINAKGEYVPDLAEKAEIVDNQTVTVTLRPGLKVSDGQTLDAQ